MDSTLYRRTGMLSSARGLRAGRLVLLAVACGLSPVIYRVLNVDAGVDAHGGAALTAAPMPSGAQAAGAVPVHVPVKPLADPTTALAPAS